MQSTTPASTTAGGPSGRESEVWVCRWSSHPPWRLVSDLVGPLTWAGVFMSHVSGMASSRVCNRPAVLLDPRSGSASRCARGTSRRSGRRAIAPGARALTRVSGPSGSAAVAAGCRSFVQFMPCVPAATLMTVGPGVTVLRVLPNFNPAETPNLAKGRIATAARRLPGR